MPPTTSQDFLKVARQRLDTATFLLKNTFTLDAMYIAGYAVECALKALILEKTPLADRGRILVDLTSGAKMHKPEVLAEFLRNLGIRLPLDLTKKFRRSTWSTGLRYETGRTDTGETRAFIKTAEATITWVKGQLP